MHVATWQEHHRARFLWNELGFSKDFDGMFYSADIGHPKKAVQFFKAINRSLGIDAGQRPLFFEDQPRLLNLRRVPAGMEQHSRR
jgi:putative hydrolase of the HAD superfamily